MNDRVGPLFDSLAPYGPASSQSQRRWQMARLASHLAHGSYSAAGQWAWPGQPADTRDRLWTCFALMQGEERDIHLANAILEATAFRLHVKPRSETEAAHPFDIFVTNHAVQMLVIHGPRLTPQARSKMETWAGAALGDFPGDRQADYQFHGYNDNMPAKATMGLVLAGEYFGDEAAVQHGLWNLRQLRDMLTRRGLLSEFTSPTYSPVTLTNLTELAAFARNAEARKLAAQCAWRVWADLLGHLHVPTGLLSGPYSRAYTCDSVGHLSSVNYLLWQALGDRYVRPNPVAELRRHPPRCVIHHRGDLFFTAAGFAWMTSCEFQPPAELIDWLDHREYPFSLIATSEHAEGGHPDSAPSAGQTLSVNLQEREFALGTSDGDWGNQADELHLQYLRGDSTAEGDMANVRVAYPRYIAGSDEPGVVRPSDNGSFAGEEDFLHDWGRTHTIQHGRVALLTSSPHPKLAGKPVSRLRQTLIFPEHFANVPRLELADGHAWLEEGPVRLAMRPLGITGDCDGERIRIERANRYSVLSLINYQGPERTFTGEELSRMLNGFALVIGLTAEESFEAFRHRILAAELLDYRLFDNRIVRYRLGETVLGLSYGLLSQAVRFATINGVLSPQPAWQATGLPAERLPFLNEPPRPNTLELPYAHLNVVWDPNRPWDIFSRGA